MSTCYGYVRASTNKQNLTYTAQQDKIKRYVDERCQSLTFAGYFMDKATSSRIPLANRKQGKEMLLRLKPGDHVVVTSFDRCFRSLKESIAQLERWMEKGIRVHVLDCPVDLSTKFGYHILQLMAWVGELQRSMIRERTSGVMNSPEMREKQRTRKERGKLDNRPPMGVIHKGAPGRKYAEKDPQEQAVMDMIVLWRDRGQLSWHDIRLRLIAAKSLTRDGRTWTVSRIQRAYMSLRQPEAFKRMQEADRERRRVERAAAARLKMNGHQNGDGK